MMDLTHTKTIALFILHSIFNVMLKVSVIYYYVYFTHTNYSGYRNDPKFSDRYAWENSADPDQTPRGAV